ncbi:MAG: YdiU family protein [Alphaproteobacteria bacterium]|nr:YdiU family protein [Alphaproteobacteria bacterium]
MENGGIRIPFDNSYARLPERFYVRQEPSRVVAPQLIKINQPLALQLGLDPEALASSEGVEILAGNRIALGSEGIALAYSGHQFGHFVPKLGDGRAILLGEVIDRSGMRRDIQLKGSGRTPFSRNGDGRAALGPVLREYIVSEAMAALGIPTTRSLAAVTTGEMVLRETPLPGAVLTRVASSHIRVGTFQYFAARGDVEAIRLLADTAIARHYPEAASEKQAYGALLDRAISRQAELVAKWMLVGFVHGVMNTDNTSIAGETIDYGPCAFLDAYHPETVFSSIDQQGRYAYGEQPKIAAWNMARFAETLLPLLSGDINTGVASAIESLDAFPTYFSTALVTGLRRKLGFFTERDHDAVLAQDLLNAMAENHADFTLTFRCLCEAANGPGADAGVRRLFENPSDYDSWSRRWRKRLAEEPLDGRNRKAAMEAVNPAYIPRNHRIEAVLSAATEDGDFAPFEALMTVLSKPYQTQKGYEGYADPPRSEQRVYRTFCGT